VFQRHTAVVKLQQRQNGEDNEAGVSWRQTASAMEAGQRSGDSQGRHRQLHSVEGPSPHIAVDLHVKIARNSHC